MIGHEHWEELAAGFALDALEPQERDDFLAHLSGCSHCRDLVDEHALVAAQLGSLAGDDGSAAPQWSAMRGAVLMSAPVPSGADVVVVHRRRRLPALAAAAAVILLVAVGVTTWRVNNNGRSPAPLASVSSCRQSAGCHVVALERAGSSRALVLVDGDRYALVPTSMPAPPAGSVWALWQVPRQGSPRLLSEFSTQGIRATLPLSYDDTAAFAVSKESAGTTPAAPTAVVATGTTA